MLSKYHDNFAPFSSYDELYEAILPLYFTVVNENVSPDKANGDDMKSNKEELLLASVVTDITAKQQSSPTMSEMKSDLVAGATRFGARKINELGRDAIVNLISEYMDQDAARQFTKFLNTDMGEALLSFGISQLIKNIPMDVIKKNKYFTAFAKELSINSYDIATGVAYEHGEMIFNTMIKPMLSSMGKIPGLREDKDLSRVVEKITSVTGKPEEIANLVSEVLTSEAEEEEAETEAIEEASATC
jgi:hypothetical protein